MVVEKRKAQETLSNNVRMMAEYNLNPQAARHMMNNMEYGTPKLQEFTQFIQHWTTLGVWLLEDANPSLHNGLSPIQYCYAFLSEKIALLKRNMHHVRSELEQVRATHLTHMQHAAHVSMQQHLMGGGGGGGSGAYVHTMNHELCTYCF